MQCTKSDWAFNMQVVAFLFWQESWMHVCLKVVLSHAKPCIMLKDLAWVFSFQTLHFPIALHSHNFPMSFTQTSESGPCPVTSLDWMPQSSWTSKPVIHCLQPCITIQAPIAHLVLVFCLCQLTNISKLTCCRKVCWAHEVGLLSWNLQHSGAQQAVKQAAVFLCNWDLFTKHIEWTTNTSVS